jgi:hypothetical protein
MKWFLLGASSSAAAIGVIWILKSRSDQKFRASRQLDKQALRYKALSKTLDIAAEMSGETCRAMFAITQGEDLLFEFIEPALLNYLGYAADEEPPRSVYDLLPQAMASHHHNWVASAIQQRCLPTRLQHPLRKVEIRHASGFYICMDLNISWIQDCKKPSFELLFASCRDDKISMIKDIRVGDQIEHADAIVMLLDIVEYTKTCSQLSATEVSCFCFKGTQHTAEVFAQVLSWMKRVRAAIEDMLLEHGMCLIETRGDNYLAITTDGDGPAPAARALRFAVRASAAVAELRGTRLRVGLASGHVTVAALRCMGGREVLCLFGDAVNVAGRLEQVPIAPAHAALAQDPALAQ